MYHAKTEAGSQATDYDAPQPLFSRTLRVAPAYPATTKPAAVSTVAGPASPVTESCIRSARIQQKPFPWLR